MIISVQCPACQTSFPVDPRKVPDGGVKVRCSVCSGIFFVEKPGGPPAPAPEPVAKVGAGAAVAAGSPHAADPVGAGPDGGPREGGGVSGASAEEAPAPDEGNVDPWSGADWDDPADMGAPGDGDPADPWSGGVGLDDDHVAEAAPEPAAETAAETAVETAAEAGGPGGGDWVIERADEDPLAATGGQAERLDTVEEQVRSAAEEWDAGAADGADDGDPTTGWDPADVTPAAEAPVAEPEAYVVPSAGFGAGFGADTGAAEAVAEAKEEAAFDAPAEPEAKPPGFQFGKRDPHDKAKRLARVLVSDIITYNPERHQRALEQDTLHADFEEEIKKSWTEYVEQVGRDIAESTPYWFDALNEILARGKPVF